MAKLWNKAVADADFSDQMLQLCRIVLLLLAQVAHINAQIMTVLNCVWPPDMSQQLALSHDLAEMVKQADCSGTLILAT